MISPALRRASRGPIAIGKSLLRKSPSKRLNWQVHSFSSVKENSNGSVANSGSAADWLVSLRKSKSEPPDEEAQRWLQAMSDLRKEWTEKSSGSAQFDVDRAFAPEGMEDSHDFWAAADAEIAQQRRTARISASAEQEAEAKALENVPIPEKASRWMNMLVNQVMRHGEKAKAYKTVNRALYLVFLRIRQDPVDKLLEALDKMAPLAQLHRIGDGGARVEVFPVPYSEMRRIGLAWKWVIEASQKRQSRDFAVRLGEEILAAIEGKGPGYEKGAAIHKAAVANRSVAEAVHQGRWKR